jgi:23S rRNA (cytosine1962-C5)-methyltransferase
VFDRAVVQAPEGAPAGALAVVFDPRRSFTGIGLWDPTSPIRVKVLHHGTPEVIDTAFWRRRLQAAIDRRAPLLETRTTMYRLVHGEGDGLPGLVVDRYTDVVVVKIYSEAWVPHLDEVVAALRAVATPRTVVLRTARVVSSPVTLPDGREIGDGTALFGEVPEGPIRCREHGIAFDVDVVHGHKTGHFLDQRDNRHMIRQHAVSKRVLDVFCSTGGFSVAAAVGGAVSVHGVDISEPALRTARHNLALNGRIPTVRDCRYHATPGDAFEVLESLAQRRERFDLIVLDPPSFASRREQVEGALRAYRRLTRLALRVLEPGGTLFQASCTSRVTVEQLATVMHEAADRAGLALEEIRRTGHGLDHPVAIPESEYLKAVMVRVRTKGSR